MCSMILTDNIKLNSFNGYIRNWRSLCAELGIALNLSKNEREEQILIKGYKRWGYTLGTHLCGSWALSLRDEQKQETFCMRDHFGIKAMYYTVTAQGKFICSYNLADILKADGFVQKLNTDVLRPYLVFGYAPGDVTFFEGVKKLLPAHYLVWNGEEIKTHPYWEAKFEPDYSRTPEEWAEIIHKTASQIVTEDSDVNRAFLSSGVDSSYLLALSNAKCAYGVGYNDGIMDESRKAEDFAKSIGRDFKRRVVTGDEYFYAASWAMYHLEQPLANASVPAFALGCRVSTKYCNSVFSGEGADEFFAGYARYKDFELFNDRKTPYYTCSHIFRDEECNDFLKFPSNLSAKDFVLPLSDAPSSYDSLSKMQYIDISLWLEGNILMSIDRIGKACGAEIHVPFCDIRMFDIARKIPSEYKLHDDICKHVLRMAASKVIPQEIAYRKKIGFYAPASVWMANDRYNADLKDKLFGRIAQIFFDADKLKRIWNRFLSGETFLWQKLNAVYAFVLWYGINFEGKGSDWLVTEKSDAKAILVYDCEKQKNLYEKNVNSKLSIGSITKLASALVIVQNIPDLENTYITVEKEVIDSIKDLEPAYAGFQEHIGKKFSCLDLLYGALLPSGCEATELLAHFVSGGNLQKFVVLMNEKMKEIGCKDTFVYDSSGLNDETKRTAHDVAVILNEVIKIPILRRILSSSFHTVPHFNDSIMTGNRLINPKYFIQNYCPYCVGGKTGTTDVAGMCICALFERCGENYIVVVLGEDYTLYPTGERMLYKVCKECLYHAFEDTGHFIHFSLPDHYIELSPGAKYTLAPSVIKNATDKKAIYSFFSSNEDVAEVNSCGIVTVKDRGIVQLTVMTQTGDYDICFLNSTGEEVINLTRLNFCDS